jgi:hypothetical protein
MQNANHHCKQCCDSETVAGDNRDEHEYGAAAGKDCLQRVTVVHRPNETKGQRPRAKARVGAV